VLCIAIDESDGQTVLGLDCNPVRSPDETHGEGSALALVRGDGDACSVAGQPELVAIDR